MFPSPIGELHFSILDIRETERVEYTVSVPYRGATFLNIFCKYVKNTDYRVSVPYRGATFLNSDQLCMFCALRHMFPSPIGELHFSMKLPPLTVKALIVSVPYRGATFLNCIALWITFMSMCRFRPLSGSYISQYSCSGFTINIIGLLSFRPLSGSYISQL